NHFPNGVVGRPFQMKKPVMISDEVVDADGHRHSVERFGRDSTFLGGGWKAHYFRVVQAFKYVQGLLVVSNHLFCNAAHQVGKSRVILIPPRANLRRCATPTGRDRKSTRLNSS